VGGTYPVAVAVVLTASVVAGVTDVWKFKVYNALTLPLLLSGLLYHAVVGGWAGFLGSLVGGLFGFGLLLVFFLRGGMGGGDVKLMAGIGAWLGVPATFTVFLAGSLAAGLYAVVLVAITGRVRQAPASPPEGPHAQPEGRVAAEVKRSDRRRRVIPFAAMIAVGLAALIVWAWAVKPPVS
jgi:prepilin peptidase CpaA